MSTPDPFDEFDQAESDPYTRFDEPVGPMPHTSAALAQVPDETIPVETEAAGGYTPKEMDAWRETLGGVMPTIGARIESKLAGVQEMTGKGQYADARKKYWQSLVLPRAVAESKDAGIDLTEHPDVVDNAKRLGMSAGAFAGEAPIYQGMSEEELAKFQADQRERIAAGQEAATKGGARRQTAARISQDVRPTMPEWSPRSIAFDAMTGIPDLLVGTAGAVAGGPAVGLAAMMASIAPEEWSAAKNQGLDDRKAATYATLSTLAQGAPEVPVLRIISGGAAGRGILRKVVGETLAESAPGKVAGTALTQGVSQAVIQGLQEGIDAGFIDEEMSLKDALDRIGRAGLMGATAFGLPLGALHAGMSRAPKVQGRGKPVVFDEAHPLEPRGEPTIAPVEAPAGAAPQEAPAVPETSAALKALQDKTISPPQMEHLESLGLARRNDLGVPFMLPAGRRALGELQKPAVRTEGPVPEQPEARVKPEYVAPRPEPPEAPRPGFTPPVDPKRMSLTEAIAVTRGEKADTHGLSATEAIRQGLDPADMKTARFGSRRVFTKGGASFDEMAELLHQHGYPVTDEKGAYSPNVLLDSIDKELRGNKQYSHHADDYLQAIAQHQEGSGPTHETVPYESDLERDASMLEAKRGFQNELRQARRDTETEPTEGQKKAGNYGKGELQFAPGIHFTMENPKGSTRSGVDLGGNRWQSTLAHDYGYINKTEGADGDHVDAFLTGKPDTGKVFVVNQLEDKPGKPRFDEHKVILGAASKEEAEATYKANYPKGWRNLGSMAELTTPDFREWIAKGDTTKPIESAFTSRPLRSEMRRDYERRKAVGAMSSEEMRHSLLTHEVTGLPNRRAYDEAPRLSHQVAVDVDSLKWVNDNLGHAHGDELLKNVAEALKAQTGQAFHVSGDEFVVQANDEAEAHEIMREVAQALGGSKIEARHPDGKVVEMKGLHVSYGVGRSLREADLNLSTHKAAREASGHRARRGEKPPGASYREGRREGLGSEDHVAEPQAPLDQQAVRDFAERTKKDLGLEDFDLRALPNGDLRLELLQVPRGSRKQGIGTEAMERLTRFADEHDRRLVLGTAGREKLGDWGTTSKARLEQFYRRFGFKPNRGRNKDFRMSISDTMSREPGAPQRDRIREDQAEYTSTSVSAGVGGALAEPGAKARDVQPGATLQLFSSDEAPSSSLARTQTHTGLIETGRFSSGIKQVKRWQDAAHIFAPLRKSPQESMMALVLDAKARPLAVIRHTIGNQSGANVTPSLLTGAIAKIEHAAGVYFGHNHPSAVTQQSSADIAITDVLHRLMRGSGIDPLGMVVVTPGGTEASFYHPMHMDDAVPGKTTPAARTKRSAVPVLERRFTRLPGGAERGGPIKGPEQARAAVIASGEKSGILFLDNRHGLAAVLPMHPKEMYPLRSGDKASGTLHVMRAAEDSNASAAITFGDAEDQEALRNLGRLLVDSGLRLNDTLLKVGDTWESRSERGGGALQSQTPFYARREPETRESLERQFMGKDDAFWGITPEDEARGRASAFESGYGGTQCTGFACAVLNKLGRARVKVFGFHGTDNPTSAIARDSGGHDFAVVDGRFIVDPWLDAELSTPMGEQGLPKRGVYDLENPADHAEIERLYGERHAWRDMTPQMPTAGRPQVERAVRQSIRESGMRAAPNFPHVEVHDDYTTLPRDLRNKVIQDHAEQIAGAVYDPQTGAIHMIADNLGTPREAVETLWHEAVGHHGLRLIMDADRYAHTMDGIWNAMPDRVRQTAERNGLDVSELAQRRMAAEEVIAYAAGQHLAGTAIDKPLRPFWQRALAAVRGFFARVSGKPFTDDRAIAGIIAESKRALESGSGLQRMGALAASQRAATFYSPVERAVTASKQGKASAEQWLATISKTPGVKPEEISWLGLEAWLKSHDGPVTREALADYVRANKLELEETHYGGDLEGASEYEKAQTHHAEALRAAGAEVEINADGSLEYVNFRGEHGDFTGQAPPELLHHLEALREASEHVNREFAEEENFGSRRGAQYEEFTLPGGENYREVLIKLPVPGDYPGRRDNPLGSDVFQSSHWQERNVLAHVRFDDRTDADGKKTLFLQELQSDWHQRGREKGYRTESRDADYQQADSDLKELRGPALEAMRRNDNLGFDSDHAAVAAVREHADWKERWTDVPKADQEILDRYRDAFRRRVEARASDAVPSAPFKSTWPMLLMKRMIRHAAEGGYERLAWTTGDTQTERYKLSTFVHDVGWRQQGDLGSFVQLDTGRGVIKFNTNAKGIVTEPLTAHATPFVGHHLSDVLGADIAKRIMEEKIGNVTGADLNIGGHGMREFYDTILPRETNKLIRRYGAEVGTTTVKADNAPEEVVERVAAEDPEHPFVQKNRTPVHTFDVTPAMREAALSQGFPMFWKKPSQQTQGAKAGQGPGWYEAVRRAVTYLHSNPVTRDMRKLINPSKLSQEAKSTAVIARAALGNLAHQTFETQEGLEKFSRQIDRLPPREQLEMLDAIEHGVPQPNADLQPVADALRKQLDTWREKVRGLGVGALDNFIENYFPHYWSKPDQAQRMIATIMGRRPLRGPASFLKMRTIPTIKEGMDAGLTPLTINPLVMTLLKVREMQRFVSGVKMMQSFKDAGLAQFLRAGKPMPDGWAEIKDNIARVRQWSEEEQGFIERGKYIMPEDGARLINNHLGRSHLADFALAQVVRVGANALNATQLGWSAWHLGFTTLDAAISKNSLGLERLAHGEVGRALAAFAEGMTPAAPVMNLRRGFKLMRAYADPAGATPEMLRIVQALEIAGGRAQMDRYYMASHGVSPFRGAGVRSLAGDIRTALKGPQPVRQVGRALANFPAEYAVSAYRELQGMTKTMPLLQVPFEIAGRFARVSTAWIMEHVVPLQKLGVFSDLAQDYLRRNPTAASDEIARAMQSAWDSVDNRLGEMVYDNLFWNRTAKDTAHLGVRAVGWNLGTIREIGGAPIDALALVDKLAREGKITADDLGHKIPYVLAMTMTTAALGASIQYLFTGQGPQELKDYFFPRTGGTTTHGTPQRLSLPSYVKDIYEYSQRPGITMSNKLNPIWSTTADIWRNQDFFGNPISEPEAGGLTQFGQRAAFAARQATPFSIQGSRQIAGSEKPGFVGGIKRVLPFIGVTPAPGYVTSAEQIERRERYEAEDKYSRELKYKLTKAMTAHDQAAIQSLKEQYVQSRRRVMELKVETQKDKAKAAAARRQHSTSMRQQGFPAMANLIGSLPLEPDSRAREYFRSQV